MSFFENDLHLSHYFLIKFIHKICTCLQFEMYLISFKKSKLLSYYVYEQISSSKKTLPIWDNFCLKIACFFYEQVCVRNRTLRKSPRIVIHAYNWCGHDRHRNVTNLVIGPIYNRLSSKRSNHWFDETFSFIYWHIDWRRLLQFSRHWESR